MFMDFNSSANDLMGKSVELHTSLLFLLREVHKEVAKVREAFIICFYRF